MKVSLSKMMLSLEDCRKNYKMKVYTFSESDMQKNPAFLIFPEIP